MLNVEDMSKEELVELLNMVVDGVVRLRRCNVCKKIEFDSFVNEREIDVEDGSIVEVVCLECLKN